MRFTILFALVTITTFSFAQPTGYYNGTEGKTGDELKTALHEIINDHLAYSYFAAKTIMKFSDADPDNPSNVILVYTGRSQANNDYGNGGNQINREHVWAKSHGNFEGLEPMYGDVHNLKPADASVNQDKSNKDFDNGGTQHPEATGCYYTSDTWEPRDEVKGDIARIIFYMDTRYEGTNGEIDLTVVDEINTYPLPEHGKLSTLLEWNMQDPPDEFERNRNNVIFSWQKNRNPFIDNPEFANQIWGDQLAPSISFGNISNTPVTPIEGELVEISASISTSQGQLSDVKLYWGADYENLNNMEIMQSAGSDGYAAEIPGQSGATTIFYRIDATNAEGTQSSIIYNYYVAPVFNGTLISIYDIQGQTSQSPFAGEEVSTAGVVTANFGEHYFLQNGEGAWNGLFIYDPGRNPQIGDSVIVTGLIEEYYDKTEMKEIAGYYHISSNHDLPEPVIINTGDGGEAYESVLVKVVNAICTDDEYQANFYMWKVNDGSGEMLVHNTSIFEFEPILGETYNVTGPLNFDFDEWKIEIRLENDVQDGTDIFPPVVNELNPINDSLIKVTYSEDVDESTATNPSNYSLNNDVTIESISMHGFLNNVVFIDVSAMPTGNYVLTINNVEDLAGNKMDNVETGFYYESTSIEELKGVEAVTVYPNPAGETINLNIDATETCDIMLRIIDLGGKARLQKQISLKYGQNIVSIADHGVSSGIYLIEFKKENQKTWQKLIVK
jgi:endonuclease I